MPAALVFGSIARAYDAAEWIARIGALMIVPLRRKPTATLSWLVFIFFLPLPGAALFVAIGNPRFPRWHSVRIERLRPFFAEVAARIPAASTPIEPAPNLVAALAETLGFLPACGGNTVELIDDYERTIERLLAHVECAQTSVDVLVYIFAKDAVGQRLAGALGRAAQRGVRCRVMFDPFGSHHWRGATFRMLEQNAVEVRAALPFHLWRGRTRRDMRNHRKLVVIDGAIGYAGSQNIVAKDFPQAWSIRSSWLGLLVRL